MVNKIIYACKYLCYFIKAKHYYGHGIHSPFIYDFVRNVLFVKSAKSTFSGIRNYRKELLKNKKVIKVNDLGAGSKLVSGSNRKISKIAASSSTRAKYGKLLSRMVAHYKPGFIVELGTSLGIGTWYLSTLMDKNAMLYTIEGDKSISRIASNFITKNTDKNIYFLTTKFKDGITKLKKENNYFDFVFFDGDHSGSATINYFEQCLTNINDESIFVFDDIHWSKDMENAWSYIKSHSKTKVCIDLFQFGLVFFRKELTKQNYKIRF